MGPPYGLFQDTVAATHDQGLCALTMTPFIATTGLPLKAESSWRTCESWSAVGCISNAEAGQNPSFKFTVVVLICSNNFHQFGFKMTWPFQHVLPKV